MSEHAHENPSFELRQRYLSISESLNPISLPATSVTLGDNYASTSSLKKSTLPLNERVLVYKRSQVQYNPGKTHFVQKQTDQAINFGKLLLDTNGINKVLFASTIRDITLNYGYQVATFFRFARDLLKINLYALPVIFFFVILPQLIIKPFVSSECSWKEALVGGSCLYDSFLFYGFYGTGFDVVGNANETQHFSKGGYDLDVAYEVCIIVFFFINFYFVSIDIFYSWRVGSQVALLSGSDILVKIFTAWDFSIGTKSDKKTQIRLMLEEELNSRNKISNSNQPKGLIFSIHIFTNIAYVCVLAGIGYAMYASTENLTTDLDGSYWKLWMLPLVVTVSNFILPTIIHLITIFEREIVSKDMHYYSQLIRNCFARWVIVIVLIYSWYQSYYLTPSDTCWQNDVASSIFRFLITDIFVGQIFLLVFINGILRNFIVSILRKNKVNPNQFQKIIQHPEFKVVDNVLDLLFSQMLSWVGILFYPTITIFVITQIILTFFIRFFQLKLGLLKIEKEKIRAVQGKTVIAVMQMVFLLTSIGWMFYVFTDNPTGEHNSCGVFRYCKDDYFDPLQNRVEQLTERRWLRWFGVILQIFGNPWFWYSINMGLLSACYAAWCYSSAHEKNILRLKQQLKDLER